MKRLSTADLARLMYETGLKAFIASNPTRRSSRSAKQPRWDGLSEDARAAYVAGVAAVHRALRQSSRQSGQGDAATVAALAPSLLNLERAARGWWASRAPVDMAEKAHLENPTINTVGGFEHALAHAVARLIKERNR